MTKRFIITLCALLLAAPVYAQTSVSGVLERFKPVKGSLSAGEAQTWTFNALEGNVLSFTVQATSGELDPRLSISTSAGATLIGNDDFDYPNSRDALLEAITIPRTDSYTLTVSSMNDTAGDYVLTMLPSFARLDAIETFDQPTNWQTVNDALNTQVADGQLTLTLNQQAQTGIAIRPGDDAPPAYYAQVNVDLGAQSVWTTGMTARQQGGDSYYLLEINQQGQWRFLLHQSGGDRILRDWKPHPAITPGDTTFTLGMMVNGAGFDFFYDGKFFGRLTDTSLPQTGKIGFTITTPDTLNARVIAHFDDLTLTIPWQDKSGGVLPQALIVGGGPMMIQELQRRRVIPTTGEMALSVDNSSNQSGRPGITQIMLAKGVTYSDLVMGATVSWTTQAAGMAGCGLIFRSTSDTEYTLAYLDQTGSYGVSRRSGDSFAPGIFGEIPSFTGSNHHLLVVAHGQQLYYYVDGLYRGRLTSPAADGAVGDAVVNFDPINTICQFTSLWVWRITE